MSGEKARTGENILCDFIYIKVWNRYNEFTVEESRSLIVRAAIVGAMSAKWHKATFWMVLFLIDGGYMGDICQSSSSCTFKIGAFEYM